MTARILKRPLAGDRLMVNAWTINIEGKKHYAGSAIIDEAGELCAEAITLWIGNQPHPSSVKQSDR